jgi:hypothetical protein
MAWISLSENLNVWYPCLHVPSTIQTGLATRDGLIEPREKAKNLERGFFGFYLSQPFEIPQNRQRNLWKSLEKTARNLEMFGKKGPVQSGLTPTAGGVVFLRRHEWKFLRSGRVRWAVR